jgi:hypothetical protein
VPRKLTDEEIDRAISALRAKDTEVISRGRGGEGFAHRGGQLYTIYVEDFDRDETPVSEEWLRKFLADLDLEDFSNRYWGGALQQLGVDVKWPSPWK